MVGGWAMDMGTYQTPNMERSKDIKHQKYGCEHTSKDVKENPKPQANILRPTI